MEEDNQARVANQEPQHLSPCNSGRRRTSNASRSPEFEFWMVRNPSFPQSNLLSADQLFVDGVLLPLHQLNLQNHHHLDPPDNPLSEADPDPEPPNNSSSQAAAAITTSEPSTASKRWKDIFKKGDKKTSKNPEDKVLSRDNSSNKEDNKEKKMRDKNGGGGGHNNATPAALNINIWPFSRSRSAGNGVSRPKMFPGTSATRKVSSAPCSRSNSAGESKSRKWPSSPGRPGVYLGRSSPVWQARRGSASGVKSTYHEALGRSGKKEVTEQRRGKTSGASGRKINNGGGSMSKTSKVLNLNVPMCIGYGQHLSCTSGDNVAGGGDGKTGGHALRNNSHPGNGGNLFNLRSFFTRKVY
ncbi:hypothetical protein K2173_001364 [Erythroxylum novogranatense]|uniref:Uncharacterized protein n=1 Tax=Erythroxylum novogranatense TaxID=1862640 RepID=A0AAV8T428_9ROSI|nr:hypothetical protein K2173_001364 [Erythroxylum novogranatense]